MSRKEKIHKSILDWYNIYMLEKKTWNYLFLFLIIIMIFLQLISYSELKSIIGLLSFYHVIILIITFLGLLITLALVFIYFIYYRTRYGIRMLSKMIIEKKRNNFKSNFVNYFKKDAKSKKVTKKAIEKLDKTADYFLKSEDQFEFLKYLSYEIAFGAILLLVIWIYDLLNHSYHMIIFYSLFVVLILAIVINLYFDRRETHIKNLWFAAYIIEIFFDEFIIKIHNDIESLIYQDSFDLGKASELLDSWYKFYICYYFDDQERNKFALISRELIFNKNNLMKAYQLLSRLNLKLKNQKIFFEKKSLLKKTKEIDHLVKRIENYCEDVRSSIEFGKKLIKKSGFLSFVGYLLMIPEIFLFIDFVLSVFKLFS